MRIRIATRKSALALWQAEFVAARLRSLPGVSDVELLPMSTKGDEILDRSLQKIGGKGLFIKELEIAMQRGDADIAVHSMKDVPAEMPNGFCLASTLERANPVDALVSRDHVAFADLPRGAQIGSSSLRRQAQLRMLRPDLRIEPLRGNVNTRLARLEAGEFDAIILAAVGLQRLELDHHITEQFTTEQMLPATAQGVLGIECLEERDDLRELLRHLDHAPTVQTTLAERTVARTLQASCQSPVATFAEFAGGELRIRGLAAMPDGSESIRESIQGTPDDAAALGDRLAQRMLAGGAGELLERAAACG
ncbi:MAG: hydroxymethylbilane synthase [Woeseiaceae bacterium]|nr:hydroxymethylbilane synthase [Woeseiaceae bacterium]